MIPVSSNFSLLMQEHTFVRATLVITIISKEQQFFLTQYTELQYLWDIEQTNKRIDRIEELFRRILATPVQGSDSYLAEWIVGRPGRVTYLNETQLRYTVCKEEYNEGQKSNGGIHSKLPLIRGVKLENDGNHLHLFSQHLIEDEVMGETSFKIDSLSYSDIHVIQNSQTRSETTVLSGDQTGWGFFQGVLTGLNVAGVCGGLAFLSNRLVSIVL